MTGKLTKSEFDIETIRSLYQEVILKERQWDIERANMEVIIDLRLKSSKETSKEYQITLEENNKLNIQLSDQRKIIQVYETEKKNFNQKVISIVSENSFSKRKL